MPKVKVYDDIEDYGPGMGGGAKVSSIVFALMMIVALVVAAAAWMGGSMAKVESGVGNALDGFARVSGLAVEQVAVLGLEDDLALRETVLAAAMIEPGENMWRADPHRIRARVEATGKVVNVTVHRLWPNQVVITAYPATPMALWHDGETWHVVDTLGRTMPGEAASDHAHLVKVSGAGAAEQVPDFAAALDVAPSLEGRIQIARHVAQRRWDVLLDSGMVVRLPETGKLPSALARLEGLNAEEQLMDRPLLSADFRLEGRVFLRPVARAVGEAA